MDREIIRVHTNKDMGENYAVDFAEVEFPQSPQDERTHLEWMMDKGLMSREDLIKFYNPDITEEDLQALMERVDQSKQAEAEAQRPETGLEGFFAG